MSSILSSIALILASYPSFVTTLLTFLKSTGTSTNFSTTNLSTLPLKEFKADGSFDNNLSISDFKSAKLTFFVNFDVSKSVAFLKSTFVAQWDQSNSFYTFPLKDFGLGKYWLVYIVPFFINPTIK